MSVTLAFLPKVGPTEVIIVLVIAIVIFGPKRIPAAAKSIGQGFRNFKDQIGSGDSEDSESDKSTESEIREKSKSGD